jgi:hypothetical protein
MSSGMAAAERRMSGALTRITFRKEHADVVGR